MQDMVAAGARLLVRDEESLMRRADHARGELLICDGISELVRGRPTQFLTRLEDRVDVVDPMQTRLVPGELMANGLCADLWKSVHDFGLSRVSCGTPLIMPSPASATDYPAGA